MEIVFDENSNHTFQNKTYPIVPLNTDKEIDIIDIFNEVQETISNNKNNKIIIITPSIENDYMYLFAALLGINYNHQEASPVCAVFKVKNQQKSLNKYRPFFLFAVSASYAYRLQQMTPKEMYSDMEKLGYLGLNTYNNYEKDTLILNYNTSGKKYNFFTNKKYTSIILVCFIKMLCLIHPKPQINITIEIKKNDDTSIISYEKLLKKLWYTNKILSHNQE